MKTYECVRHLFYYRKIAPENYYNH